MNDALRRLEEFHHYGPRADLPTPVEALERTVLELLITSDVPQERRTSSVAFELKHSSAVLQFGRLLAQRRGLPADIAAAGALLHDIYVVVEGTHSNHARLGAPIAADLMRNAGFNEADVEQAVTIVANHSDKHLVSPDPLVEFGKDADILDCFLYPGAFDFYLLAKPLDINVHYLRRAKDVWQELNVPVPAAFHVLDTYRRDGWFDTATPVDSIYQSGISQDWQSTTPFAVRYTDAKTNILLHPHEQEVGQSILATIPLIMDLARLSPGQTVVVWPAANRFEIANSERLKQFTQIAS